MHKKIVLGLVLAVMACKTSSLLGLEAHAQTVLVLASSLDHKTTLSVTTSAETTPAPGIMVRTFVVDPVGVARVLVQGNGTILATCLKDICNVFWDRIRMVAGDNVIYLTAYNIKGGMNKTRAVVQRP